MSQLEIMKKRLEALKNNSKPQSKEKKVDELFWISPKLGEPEKHVRILSPNSEDPFCEVSLHRIGNNWPFMSLKALDSECDDPIHEFVQMLWTDWRTAKENGDEATKKKIQEDINSLKAKPNYYLTILVRGEEDKGPRMWMVSKTIYEKILEKYVHPDFGSLHDPKEGYDVIVKAIPTEKSIGGKKLPKETAVDFRIKQTPLAKTDKEIKEILSKCPDMMEEIKTRMLKSYEEVKEILNKHIETLDGEEEVKSLDSKDANDRSLEELMSK